MLSCLLHYQQLSVKMCVHVFEEFYCFGFIQMLTLKQWVCLLLSLLPFLGDFRIPFINFRTGKQEN